jgi:purine-binding chemotaxis protein CheW
LDSTATLPDISAIPTLLFRVGETLCGCNLSEAQEVIPLRPVTRLPGAPGVVRGLINMRGTIVTVLNLGVRIDPSRPPAVEGSILLVRYRDRLVGVVVDEVMDVRQVTPPDAVTMGSADHSGADGGGGARTIVRGVASLDGASVMLLDLDALITQVLLSRGGAS